MAVGGGEALVQWSEGSAAACRRRRARAGGAAPGNGGMRARAEPAGAGSRAPAAAPPGAARRPTPVAATPAGPRLLPHRPKRRRRRLGLRPPPPRLARRRAGGTGRDAEAGRSGARRPPGGRSQRQWPATAKVEADQPLGALSVDIAKAIDHDASVELWERHRRGEQNVFTRRLYTLQGQQTFDEIRKKYQRDAKFRTAVDRYVGDFEKLLAEVNRKNGDNRAASNAYLTSDTGKVYTMLAHASGRFD